MATCIRPARVQKTAPRRSLGRWGRSAWNTIGYRPRSSKKTHLGVSCFEGLGLVSETNSQFAMVGVVWGGLKRKQKQNRNCSGPLINAYLNVDPVTDLSGQVAEIFYPLAPKQGWQLRENARLPTSRSATLGRHCFNMCGLIKRSEIHGMTIGETH